MPRTLCFRERDSVPVYKRLSGPQGRSGRVRKTSPSPGFFFVLFFSPDRPTLPTELPRPTCLCMTIQKRSSSVRAAYECRYTCFRCKAAIVGLQNVYLWLNLAGVLFFVFSVLLTACPRPQCGRCEVIRLL